MGEQRIIVRSLLTSSHSKPIPPYPHYYQSVFQTVHLKFPILATDLCIFTTDASKTKFKNALVAVVNKTEITSSPHLFHYFNLNFTVEVLTLNLDFSYFLHLKLQLYHFIGYLRSFEPFGILRNFFFGPLSSQIGRRWNHVICRELFKKICSSNISLIKKNLITADAVFVSFQRWKKFILDA